MSIGEKLQGCDKFGATVSFTHEGRTNNGTCGGGIASVGLLALTFGYLCKSMLAMANFDDPSINIYTVLEDRRNMETPINVGDNN